MCHITDHCLCPEHDLPFICMTCVCMRKEIIFLDIQIQHMLTREENEEGYCVKLPRSGPCFQSSAWGQCLAVIGLKQSLFVFLSFSLGATSFCFVFEYNFGACYVPSVLNLCTQLIPICSKIRKYFRVYFFLETPWGYGVGSWKKRK